MSKIIRAFIYFSSMVASTVQALDLTTIYRPGCQTSTGIVLQVKSNDIVFLDISGSVAQVPRYELLGLAVYPVPELPIGEIKNDKGIPLFTFEFFTLKAGSLIPLASGWPIGFSDEKIQVVNLKGREELVRRDLIWRANRNPMVGSQQFSSAHAKRAKFELRHPVHFEKCPAVITSGDGSLHSLLPNTEIHNPVDLKQYFDGLERGYAKLLEYEDRETFYEMPQEFTNKTVLGTFALLKSRYVNIGARRTNFLPIVEDQLSEGPFAYQRVFRSGLAPIHWSLHDEPQPQLFYGLKADYIRLEMFFDPMAPLIGSLYHWSRADLDGTDDRINEAGGIEFGFDFGTWAITVANSQGNIGIRHDDIFGNAVFSYTRYGLRFRRYLSQLSFYYGPPTDVSSFEIGERKSTTGSGTNEKTVTRDALSFFKVIYECPAILIDGDLRGEFIQRSLSDRTAQDMPFQFKSINRTGVLAVNFKTSYRSTVNIITALEDHMVKTKWQTDDEESQVFWHPKVGAGFTIGF